MAAARSPSLAPAPSLERSAPAAADCRPSGWALALVVAVAAAHESRFIHYGLNQLDESWQLYAAMRMHAGGTLYDDVLWVFPPGHVFTAWIAAWLDPPGLIVARQIYAAFSVALAASIYVLARRLAMSQAFSVLAGLLVALAAPRSHAYQLLFGYRYLVLPVLALLAFDRRLRGGGPAWMWAAGLTTGVALVFRLTPAFSVSCGIAVGLVAASRSWRQWLPDGLRFAGGLAAATAPALVWFGSTVGLERFWQEVVVHPLAMLQPLPLPGLDLPAAWSRTAVMRLFIALQFRAIWVLYAAYLAVLAWTWARAARRAEPFRHALLLALVVFGAVFFVRSTGRSDFPHLDSVIPPVCLLVAHALGLAFDAAWGGRADGRRRTLAAGLLCAGALLSWTWLIGSDRVLFPRADRIEALQSIREHVVVNPRSKALEIDRVVELIRDHTEPDEVILNLAPTPMFHVLTERTGPGYFDTIMPGTFLHRDDEAWFLARLKADPPAAVIWPTRDFDDMPERSVSAVAPEITRWIWQRYVPLEYGRWVVMLPRERVDPSPAVR